MKNIEIINIVNGLQNFSAIDKKFPALFTYAFMRNFKKLNEIKDTLIEAHNILLKDCVDINEDGSFKLSEDSKSYILKENKKDYYHKQYEELLDAETEVEIKTFSIDSLKDIELTIEDMAAIEFMIED